MEKKYLIGVPEMDEQHATLFDLLARTKYPDLQWHEIQRIVIDLLDYSIKHLDMEEAFLKKNGLGWFVVGHEKLHIDFRSHAMDLYQKLRETEGLESQKALLISISDFCEAWLKNHIDIEDRRYAALLRKPGGKNEVA
ncbi:MAG: hemerythrin family protein [Bdellovibrionota bacterium]